MTEPFTQTWTGDDLSDSEFTAITELLRDRRQFDLGQYKDRCIRRRIAKRLRACNVTDFESYLQRLEIDRDELDTLLATISIPNFIKLQGRAKEAKVKGAAHTLQLSAEDFAVRNGGIYSDAGADLLPMLPINDSGGRNLENAFTGADTEPQFAGAAATAGQVGIVAVIENAVAVGYTINGWGKDAEVVELTSGQ